MKSDNRRYVPLLDVFRATAAWWVLFYHTWQRFGPDLSQWVGHNPVMVMGSQGWLAVSIFIMLSGYSLSLGLRRGEIMWSAYLKARWLRIAPLYLVVFAVGTLAVTSAGAVPTTGSFLAGMSMLPIPGAFSPGPWLDTSWSVRVELVLYLFLPVFVYAARRYRPVPLLLMAGALALVVFPALYSQAYMMDILYGGLPGRLVEFAVGFAIGYAGRVVHARSRRVALAVGCFGFVGLSFVTNRAGGHYNISPAMRVAVFLAVLVFGALLLIAAGQRAKPSRNRLVPLLAAVGSWSYSTYLWHMVVLKLLIAPLLFDQETFLGHRASFAVGMVLMIAIVLALSWASYNLIELPFLSMRPQYIKAGTAGTGGEVSAEPPAPQPAATSIRAHRQGGPLPRPPVPMTRHGRTEPTAESVGAGGRA
jgi:peptidoglycan/LPS O-acetylase OafA/YrhL